MQSESDMGKNKTTGTTGTNGFAVQGVAKPRKKTNKAASTTARTAANLTSAATPPTGEYVLTDPAHRKVFAQLNDAFAERDHELFVVGGAVRSLMLGQSPKDIDLCTSAMPDETKAIIDKYGSVYPLGEEFGTIAVNVDGEDYEITTYRKEEYEQDSRHPTVEFGGSIDTDLSRRDFTINAAAITADGNLYDPYGAAEDIDAQIIRSVGDANDRFTEDPLRIIRGARFAATLNFDIDSTTSDAMKEHGPKLSTISRERVWAELSRTVGKPGQLATFVSVTDSTGTTSEVFGTELAGQPPKDNALAQYAWMHDNGVNLHSMTAPREVSRDAKTVSKIAATTDPVEYRDQIRKHAPNLIDAAAQLTPPPEKLDTETVAQLRQPLPVDGNDLITEGLKGPAIGDAIRRIETSLTANPRWLNRSEAINIAKDIATP